MEDPMATSATHAAESRDLHRYLRDLAALTALPSIWSGADRRSIAIDLADLLLKVLPLDFAYVRLNRSSGEDALEVASADPHSDNNASAEQIGQALARWLTGPTGETVSLSLSSVLGRDRLQAARCPVGPAGESGLVLAASRLPGFPTEADRLILSLTINQAAILLRRQQSEAALHARERQTRLLNEAARYLLSVDDPKEMLQGLFERVRAHFGLDGYFNFMINDAGNALKLVSCAGVTKRDARSITRLDYGKAISDSVAMERLLMTGSQVQPSDDQKARLIRCFGIRAYASIPLLAGDRFLGTLSFASKTRDDFDDDELEFLRTLCHYVAAAYQRILNGR
jgi:GAF domain-containing protein